MSPVEKEQRFLRGPLGNPGAIKELGPIPGRKFRFDLLHAGIPGQAHRLPLGWATGALALQTV
jgi:hypothetical protein